MAIQHAPAYTDAELITRVWDQEEIRNLIGRYAYFEAGNRREEALERFWVRDPEYQKTASLGRNWGFLEGMDAIKDYYVGRNRFGEAGTALMHPLSTKLLCEAYDGKTAQGIWMGISYEMADNIAGELDAKWINERVAVDFVRENGTWRIWHMFIGTNYVLSAGECYSQQPLNTRKIARKDGCPDWYVVGRGRERSVGEVALFDQIPEYAEREVFLNGNAPEEIYSALYNDQIFFPHLPTEYQTFTETVGYDRKGFEQMRGASKAGRVW